MSKGQRLRALVKERLTAAAEEIFALFETAIAEYEEELCRLKEEKQRKHQRLDLSLSPNIVPVRAVGQSPSTGPGPGVNQEISDTSRTKEEPEEQEEEQLRVLVPDFTAVCVKSEELSLLQERQIEHLQDTQEEDSSDTNNDDEWEPRFSCSDAPMETEVDEDLYNQSLTKDRSTAAQISHLTSINKYAPGTSASVNNGDTPKIDGDEGKKHQCSVCKKRFKKKDHLQTHKRVHTGERPYSCSICKKAFAHKSTLDSHGRTHTGEKPFSCLICKKDFAGRFTLKQHLRTHTGEKPYFCSLCHKTFSQNSTLYSHMKTHR